MRCVPPWFQKRLKAEYEHYDCVWDRGKERFVVRMRTSLQASRPLYAEVLVLEGRKPPGGRRGPFRDIGSGDWVIRELRSSDARRHHSSKNRAWLAHQRMVREQEEQRNRYAEEQNDYAMREAFRDADAKRVYTY